MKREKTALRNNFIAAREDELLNFLFEALPGVSRNKIKSYLAHRQVSVNDVMTTKYNLPLKPGDKVSVAKGRGPEAFRHPMLRILYEDDHIIVVDKRNGLLSVGTDKERTRTAYYLMSEHVKRSDPANRIFIVHRLDRETSGVMMLAKSEKVQEKMQKEWAERVLDRRYVAVVEGSPAPQEGTVDAPLSENKNFKVYVDEEGSRAVTCYKTIATGVEYSLVELSLETGRKNQIRTHMEHIGHPVAGDKKYGAATDPLRRVCLHAAVLNILHPVTDERMDFCMRAPFEFESVVASRGGGGAKTAARRQNAKK